MNKSKGFVWLDTKGKYLRVSERNTHTGYHIDVSFEDDINMASVMPVLDRQLLKQHPEVKNLIRIAATCEVIQVVTLETCEYISV